MASQAARDEDLALKCFVLAAEMALMHGDTDEAEVACSVVARLVDDVGRSNHLTLIDQASSTYPWKGSL